VDKIIIGKSGWISLFNSLPLIFKLRGQKFDIVAVLYNNEDGVEYENARAFASLIKAKKRIGITACDEFLPFSYSLMRATFYLSFAEIVKLVERIVFSLFGMFHKRKQEGFG
jgi:ADP-heptose:LPS heptosyltransferase